MHLESFLTLLGGALLILLSVPFALGRPASISLVSSDNLNEASILINRAGLEDSGFSSRISAANNTRHYLGKRQCVKGADGGWECDFLWPTIPEMIARLYDTANGGLATSDRSAYFYTNIRNPTPAENPRNGPKYEIHTRWTEGWMKAIGILSFSFKKSVNLGWMNTQTTFIIENWDLMEVAEKEGEATKGQVQAGTPAIGKDDAHLIFIWCFLQATCQAATNPEAYLFTTKGQDWEWNSVWKQVEFWVLTRNKNIQKIWRVDPAPGACTDDPKKDREILWDRSRDPERPANWVCPVRS